MLANNTLIVLDSLLKNLNNITHFQVKLSGAVAGSVNYYKY